MGKQASVVVTEKRRACTEYSRSRNVARKCRRRRACGRGGASRRAGLSTAAFGAVRTWAGDWPRLSVTRMIHLGSGVRIATVKAMLICEGGRLLSSTPEFVLGMVVSSKRPPRLFSIVSNFEQERALAHR